MQRIAGQDPPYDSLIMCSKVVQGFCDAVRVQNRHAVVVCELYTYLVVTIQHRISAFNCKHPIDISMRVCCHPKKFHVAVFLPQYLKIA